LKSMIDFGLEPTGQTASDLLVALIADLGRGTLRPAVAHWLGGGLGRWLAGSGDLAACLELRGDGGNRPRQAVMLQLRDFHIREAAKLCKARDPVAQAKELAAEIATFESAIWPRFRDLEYPPESALRSNLFHARKLNGKPLPGFRRIFDILK